MGQYWKILTEQGGKYQAYGLQTKRWREEKDKPIEKINWGLFVSQKLLEHTYRGCPPVEFIYKKLFQNPMRVAWVGEYADTFKWEDGRKTPNPAELHKLTWEEEPEYVDDIPSQAYNKGFLLNHDTHEYIDLNGIEHDYAIVPLITACGDSDYTGENYKMVGLWCMNTLSIEKEVPKGYNKIYCKFYYND